MTDHEWRLSEGSGVYCFTHHHRACMMSNAEAIAILNEHGKLKEWQVEARKLFEELDRAACVEYLDALAEEDR